MLDANGDFLAAGDHVGGADDAEQLAVARVALDAACRIFGRIHDAACAKGEIHGVAAAPESVNAFGGFAPFADELAVGVEAANALARVFGDEHALIVRLDVHLTATSAEAVDDHFSLGELR